jgi:hypothetical protein
MDNICNFSDQCIIAPERQLEPTTHLTKVTKKFCSSFSTNILYSPLDKHISEVLVRVNEWELQLKTRTSFSYKMASNVKCSLECKKTA